MGSQKILYLQADHFLMKGAKLYDIAEYFTQHGGEYLAIDEIHKYPDWSMELKSISDTFENLKILASGSSALEITQGSHDLSRRALVFRMHGLSLREFLEIEHGVLLKAITLKKLVSSHIELAQEWINLLAEKNIKILPAFKKYLEEGYYPYRRGLNSREHYQITLEQNIHVTLESDLVAIHPELTGRSIARIKKLLSWIANQVPFTPNWSKITGLLELGDTRTVKQYFQYLEAAELVMSFGSQSKKLKALEIPEKVFLNNPNLIYALCSEHPEIGTVRETFFSNMLSYDHDVTVPAPNQGDFMIDQKFIFEIGGAKKDFEQFAHSKEGKEGKEKAFVVADNIEIGFGQKIPLWMFGFLY